MTKEEIFLELEKKRASHLLVFDIIKRYSERLGKLIVSDLLKEAEEIEIEINKLTEQLKS